MNPQRKEELERGGVDVCAALERMMGSEALLERLLGKFPEDASYAALGAALDQGDANRAVAAAHTLEGICGNLSLTALFSLFTRQVAALRRGDLEEAQTLMAQISPAYTAAVAAIRGDGHGMG